MNHNFLPYEVCELLPQVNPYLAPKTKEYSWYKNTDFAPRINYKWANHKSGYLRDAWTIIDALQYLEDKHNIVVITYPIIYEDRLFGWGYSDINSINHAKALKKYESRTQAYIEGIKEALKLI